MASSAKSGTIRRSQRSVLDLDRGSEPFPAKVAEVCDILGIELRPPGLYLLLDDTQKLNVGKYGPREEWALRWLLKNFQSTDLQPGSPCAGFRAWLLLRELLVLNPPSNIARLLNAHNFTVTLQRTFNWLKTQVGHSQSFPIIDSHENAEAIADSSSATIETSPSDQFKKSRKRKRDGSHISSSQSTNPGNESECLYVSICSAIKQLNTLIGVSLEGSLDFATEHLESAFRSSPEQAAEILGSGLEVSSFFIDNTQPTLILGDLAHDPRFEDRSQYVRDIARVHDTCISAVVSMWDSRSVTSDDLLDQLSVRVFSTYALLPILQNLRVYESLSSSSPREFTIIQALEHLLVQYIILPARASFTKSKSWNSAAREDQASLTAEILLRPLAGTSDAKSRESSLVNSADLVTSAIPLLFRIAIHSLSRITSKHRSIEDSWLRHLFSQLEHCTSKSVLQLPHYISILIRMLRDALDHKVRLDDLVCAVVLPKVLNNSEGGFDTPDAPLYWTLIGLCLEIDANFFLTSVNENSQGNSGVTPNKNLASLLSQITETDGKMTPYGDINTAKLSKIVLPLAQAFAHARDLAAFLFIWEQQLTVCQQQRSVTTSNSVLPRSVWEDEKLILFVGHLIESSLTAGQIELVFQKIHTCFTSLESAGSTDRSNSLADLVILDSLVSGLAKESILSQLIVTVRPLYLCILGIVSDASNWPARQLWRFWRILTTFKERWPQLQGSITCKEAERLATDRAQELVHHSLSAEATNMGQVYLRKLYAFSFILSHASVQDIETDTTRSITDRATSVIETILSYRQSLCDNMSLGLIEYPMSTELVAQWDTQDDKISSVEVLLVGYICQIVTLPCVLSYLKVDLQHRFFQQLYWSAVAFKKARQPETGFINYLTIWQTLLDSELLRENVTVATSFRNFQASVFLAASNFQGSSRQRIDGESYELAFRGIQRTPVRAYDRGKRNKILDGLLRSLTSAELSTTMITDHISLLIEYICSCNNPFRVLFAIHKNSAEGPVKQLPADESPLLALVHRLDGEPGLMSTIVAMRALKRLVQCTLRRCVSTISQEKIVECLASFYDQLIKAGKDDFPTFSQHAFTSVFETSLSIFVQNISNFPELLKTKADSVKSLRLRHVQSLCDCLSRIHGDKTYIEGPIGRSETFLVLEGMISYSDLLAQSKLAEVSRQLSEMSEVLQTHKVPKNPKYSNDESVSSDHLLVQITRLETLWGVSKRNFRPAVLQAIKVLRTMRSPSDRKRLLRHFQHTVTKAEPEDRTALLRMLGNSEEGQRLDPENLLLLQRVILAQGDSKTRSEPYALELAQTFTALCSGLVHLTDFRARVLMMQSMSLFLRKEPRTISQWHIDSLLAAIAIVSARLVGTNDEQSTGVTYLGLCRMFSLILAMHRVKLGGRYHLVVPALQGLLRCLFALYPTASATWTTREHVSGVGAAHAAAYARLLTTICDPTVSAVTRSSKASRRGLTDDTKKARSTAGQHLQYVVMEYCHCQLTGRLQPEMKACLAAGLYAILDVMSHEVMRTMNEAMDSSCRSIFKALYEEHGRVGKRRRR
ncbi:hypothetical protein MMC07_001237 [Pseudocyphellaria aurata]|nr:hypothetical protein [Pseudocyphellaria aurata]